MNSVSRPRGTSWLNPCWSRIGARLGIPPWRVTSILAAAVLTLLGAPLAWAQEESATAGAVFETVDVTVVNVEVWVRDRQGNPLTGLGRDDFALTVDGRPTPITNFYAESPPAEGVARSTAAPPGTVEEASSAELSPLDVAEERGLKLVVFVDNTHLRPVNRKKVFLALREFLHANLTPRDAVMVVGLSPQLRIYSDFINDQRAIEAILDEVQKVAGQDASGEIERRRVLSELSRLETASNRGDSVNPAIHAGGLVTSIRAYAQEEYQKARYSLDVVTAFTETLAGVPGRKALLLVSDGIPTQPGEEMLVAFQERFANNEGLRSEHLGSGAYSEEIGNFDLLPEFTELARRANAVQVTVYPIDAEGDDPGRLRSAALEGGVSSQALSVAENNYREPMELVAERTGGRRLTARPQLAKDLGRLGEDFSAFYSLGFEAKAQEAGKPLKVRVEVHRKGAEVRHREDYLLRDRDTRSADATIAALLFNETPNPMGVGIEVGTLQARDQGVAILPLTLSIPVGRLTLIPEQGTWNGQVTLFVAARAKDGSTRPVQKVPFHLSIPEAAIDEARTQPARYTLPLVVQPGDQYAAITVRDDYGLQQASLRLDLTSVGQ